jgi:hypothetical protein
MDRTVGLFDLIDAHRGEDKTEARVGNLFYFLVSALKNA